MFLLLALATAIIILNPTLLLLLPGIRCNFRMEMVVLLRRVTVMGIDVGFAVVGPLL